MDSGWCYKPCMQRSPCHQRRHPSLSRRHGQLPQFGSPVWGREDKASGGAIDDADVKVLDDLGAGVLAADADVAEPCAAAEDR